MTMADIIAAVNEGRVSPYNLTNYHSSIRPNVIVFNFVTS